MLTVIIVWDVSCRVGRDSLGTVWGEPRDGPRTAPEQTLGHNPKQQFNHWSTSVPRVHVRNLPTKGIYTFEWRLPFSGYKRTDTTTKKEGIDLGIRRPLPHYTPHLLRTTLNFFRLLPSPSPTRAAPLSAANMVLLWRGGKEDGSLSQFDGSKPADFHKFFFVFENVATSGKSDEERAFELLRYLEGDAFDFFYQSFVKNGDISADGSDYQKVKKALVERFARLNHLKM